MATPHLVESPSPIKKEETRKSKGTKTGPNQMNSTVAALDLSDTEGVTTILSPHGM